MQREVTLIFGQTGTGKTTHAKKILSETSRALVLEADFGEFQALQFYEYNELLEYLTKSRCFSNFDKRPASLSNTPFRVAYSPRTSEHDLLFHTAYELGNCTLILDEADRFEDPRYNEEYDEVITRGRHYGVGVVACGLHIYKLPKELRRQATRVIAMRQTDRSDIDALSEIVGQDAYRLCPDHNGKFQISEWAHLDWTRVQGTKFYGALTSEKQPLERKSLTNPETSATIPSQDEDVSE